jgi:hypothetical protein
MLFLSIILAWAFLLILSTLKSFSESNALFLLSQKLRIKYIIDNNYGNDCQTNISITIV